MHQTMAQILLARATGRDHVRVGEIVECVLDRILIHEGIGWGIADALVMLLLRNGSSHVELVIGLGHTVCARSMSRIDA